MGSVLGQISKKLCSSQQLSVISFRFHFGFHFFLCPLFQVSRTARQDVPGKRSADLTAVAALHRLQVRARVARVLLGDALRRLLDRAVVRKEDAAQVARARRRRVARRGKVRHGLLGNGTAAKVLDHVLLVLAAPDLVPAVGGVAVGIVDAVLAPAGEQLLLAAVLFRLRDAGARLRVGGALARLEAGWVDTAVLGESHVGGDRDDGDGEDDVDGGAHGRQLV